MKTITEEEFGYNPEKLKEITQLQNPLLKTVLPELNKRYDNYSSLYLAVSRASKIKYLVGELEGKRILDLGCGSVHSGDDEKDHGMYEPWLCRVLSRIGARVVGIDKSPQGDEGFESYAIDLYSPFSLQQFKDREFDLACSFSLVDSPLLGSAYGSGAGAKLFRILTPQLERIVKTDGFFLFEGDKLLRSLMEESGR